MKRQNPIILALDGLDLEIALGTASCLRELIGGVKVNALLDLCGVSLIEDLKTTGLLVMADPKIKDTPEIMIRRVKPFVDSGADFVTIMADNTIEAMKAAMKVCQGSNTRPVAVTVLTSIGEAECNYIYSVPINVAVSRFARAAIEAGIPGIVCPPNKIEILKGLDLFKITPGIRLAGQEKDDHKQVNTPGAAIYAGADYLVIGRAILNAGDGTLKSQQEAIKRILDEIEIARIRKKAEYQK